VCKIILHCPVSQPPGSPISYCVSSLSRVDLHILSQCFRYHCSRNISSIALEIVTTSHYQQTRKLFLKIGTKAHACSLTSCYKFKNPSRRSRFHMHILLTYDGSFAHLINPAPATLWDVARNFSASRHKNFRLQNLSHYEP
jgi:hypothetical protein